MPKGIGYNKNIIGDLRGRFDPHYKLASNVEGIEKGLGIEVAQIHKTLSKSFAMQRKTLVRVLGLEKRVNVLELEQAAEEQAKEGIDEIINDLGEEAREDDVIIPEVLQPDAEIGGDGGRSPSNVGVLDGEKKPPFKINRKIIKVKDLKKGTSQESLENIQPNNEVTDLAIREPRPDVDPKVITPEVLPPEEGVSQSPVGEGLKNILNSIAGTTESIKNILIGEQQADRDAAQDAARDAESSARDRQEKRLETKVFDGVKKVGEKVLKPVQGIFEKIWGFVKKVLLADILRRLFNWLSDDNNKKKVGSIFRFVKDFWPALLTGFLLFGTGIGSLITGTIGALASFIPTLVGMLPGLLAFLASPIGLAVLGTAAVVGGGMWVANKIKGDDKDKKIESSEPVKMNKGGSVPGKGNTDTVPAMLTPGEFVLTKEATEKYGTDTLESMNAAAATGKKETSGIGRGIGSVAGGFTGAAVGFFADSPVSPVADFALGMAGSAAGGEIGDNIERKVRGYKTGGEVQNDGKADKDTVELRKKWGLPADFNLDNPEHKALFVEKVAGPSMRHWMKMHNETVSDDPDSITGEHYRVHMDRDGKVPDFGKTVANMSEWAFNQSVQMTQQNEAIEPEIKEAIIKKMVWIRKGTLDDPNFKTDIAFHVNKDIPGTAADRLMMRAQADTRSPAARAGFTVEQRARLMNRVEQHNKKRDKKNKGGLVQHFNMGGLVQYFNRGGLVLRNGRVNISKLDLSKHQGGLSDKDYNGLTYDQREQIRRAQLKQRVYKEQGLPVPTRPSVLDGTLSLPQRRKPIKKTKSGGGLEQGYDSDDPRSKKAKGIGLGRMLGGAADFLTGNLTDFDGKGGKTFGASRVLAGAADALTGNRWDFDKHGKPAKVAKSKPKHTDIAPPPSSSRRSGSNKPNITAINAGRVGNTIDATQKTSPPQVPHFTATLYRSVDKIKTLGIMV